MQVKPTQPRHNHHKSALYPQIQEVREKIAAVVAKRKQNEREHTELLRQEALLDHELYVLST